jgi:hypothetical protein
VASFRTTGRLRGVGLPRTQRHPYGKSGPDTDGAFDGNCSPEAPDNTVTDRQPQSGSLADLLGRIERHENPVHLIGGDTLAGVGNIDLHHAVDKGAGDLYSARTADGVDGIVDHIQQHLLELIAIGDYFGHVGFEITD